MPMASEAAALWPPSQTSCVPRPPAEDALLNGFAHLLIGLDSPGPEALVFQVEPSGWEVVLVTVRPDFHRFVNLLKDFCAHILTDSLCAHILK